MAKITLHFSVCETCYDYIANGHHPDHDNIPDNVVKSCDEIETHTGGQLVVGNTVDGHFSWWRCDICNELPGLRYDVFLLED